MELDLIDRNILDALKKNARQTNQQIGETVGLTHSACARRIKRLEKSGVIERYTTVVNREALGLTIHTFANIRRNPAVPWDVVAARLADLDFVVGCYAVSGDLDILIEVIAPDMEHYSRVVLQDIFNTKGVDSVRSYFVMREVLCPI